MSQCLKVKKSHDEQFQQTIFTAFARPMIKSMLTKISSS